jgi:hypothetical protein
VSGFTSGTTSPWHSGLGSRQPDKRYFPPGPEPKASSEFALPRESEPKKFWVTTETPTEKSHGTIVEGTWTIAGDVIRVRDLEGRLFLEKLGPNDDPEYVARRLLRQKSGQSTFHAPIKYRPSYH